jgi:hypothetical protein
VPHFYASVECELDNILAFRKALAKEHDVKVGANEGPVLSLPLLLWRVDGWVGRWVGGWVGGWVGWWVGGWVVGWLVCALEAAECSLKCLAWRNATC